MSQAVASGSVVETATINIFRNAEKSEHFAAGDVIFAAGDPGDRFFVVREGTVTLSVGGRNLEDARMLLRQYAGSRITPDDPPRSEVSRLLKMSR